MRDRMPARKPDCTMQHQTLPRGYHCNRRWTVVGHRMPNATNCSLRRWLAAHPSCPYHIAFSVCCSPPCDGDTRCAVHVMYAGALFQRLAQQLAGKLQLKTFVSCGWGHWTRACRCVPSSWRRCCTAWASSCASISIVWWTAASSAGSRSRRGITYDRSFSSMLRPSSSATFSELAPLPLQLDRSSRKSCTLKVKPTEGDNAGHGFLADAVLGSLTCPRVSRLVGVCKW